MIRGPDPYMHEHGAAVQFPKDAYDAEHDRWRDDEDHNGPIGIVKDVFRQTDHSWRYLVHWPERPDPDLNVEVVYGWKEITPVDPGERSQWASAGGLHEAREKACVATEAAPPATDHVRRWWEDDYKWLLD